MSLDPKVAHEVFRRDSFRCRHCRWTNELTPHHIIFRSHRGSDEFNNLITLCWQCHRALHDGKLIIEVLKLLCDNVLVRFKRVGDWKPQ